MKIKVSNKILIEGASPSMIKTLKASLEIKNPAFQVMLKRHGRKVYFMKNVKQKFEYYEYDEDNNIFSCGRGNLKRIIKYFEDETKNNKRTMG